MQNGNDRITDTIQETGSLVTKAENFIGALSGNPASFVALATDDLTDRVEDKVLNNNLKLASDGIKLGISGFRAATGDPFAAVEFSYRVIKFFAQNGFKDSITVPSNVKLKPKTSKKLRPKKAKKAQLKVQSTAQPDTQPPIHSQPQAAQESTQEYSKASLQATIDTSNSHVEEVEVTLTMEDLIDLDEFLVNLEGVGYEALEALHASYQAELQGDLISRKHDEISQVYQSDMASIKAKMDPLIQAAKNWEYDPDGLLEEMKDAIDEAYEERNSILEEYYDEISDAKSNRQTAFDLIAGTKDLISDYKVDLILAKGAERRELFELKKSAYESLDNYYNDLASAKVQLSAAFTALNEQTDTESIDIRIQELKNQRYELKQRYVQEFYDQKSSMIEDLKERTEEQRQLVGQLKSYIIQAIHDIRNTIVKRKDCNWKCCIGEHTGGKRQFDLNYGQLSFFVNNSPFATKLQPHFSQFFKRSF